MKKTFRIVKVDYTPKQSSNNPTIVLMTLSDKKGERRTIQIKDTLSSFWVKEDPKDVIPDEEYELYVSKVEPEGGFDDEGKPLYRIYCKWPWSVEILRDYFAWHGRADIPYKRSVRYFNRWRTFVTISDEALEKDILDPEDIKPVKKTPDSEEYPHKIAFFDIETDDKVYAIKGTPRMPVVCASIVVDDEIYHICNYEVAHDKIHEIYEQEKARFPWIKYHINIIEVRSEEELYEEFGNVLKKTKPTVISGWNIEDFDISYMERRAIYKNERNNGNYKIPSYKNIQIFDLITAYQMMIEGTLTSFGKKALNTVSMKVLKSGKVDRETIHEMLETNVEKLSVYNMFDTIICREIDLKMELVKFYTFFSDSCYIELADVFYATVSWESILTHEYKENYITMSRMLTPYDQRHREGSGSVVHVAAEGIFDNVIDFDLSREYPSVMMTGAIDPSNYILDDNFDWEHADFPVSVFPSGRCYRNDPSAPLVSKLFEQYEKRVSYKKILGQLEKEGKMDSEEYKLTKLKDKTAKGLMNSAYGVFRNWKFAYCNRGIGQDIVDVAKIHWYWNRDLIEKTPFVLPDGTDVTMKVIYGDTDSAKSCVVCKRPVTENELELIGAFYEKVLNDSYDEFAKKIMKVDKHYFGVKKESVAKIYIQWGKKKRYVSMDYKNQMTVKGVEIRRADASELTKEIQTKMFDIFCKTRDKVLVIEMIQEYLQALRAGEINDKTKITQGIHEENNDLYPHMIRSNRLYGKHMKKGDRVAYYYCRSGIVVLEVDDDVKDFDIELDYDEIVKKQILSKTKDIAAVMGINMEEITSGIVKGSYDTIFG